jgi:hypothetical protein
VGKTSENQGSANRDTSIVAGCELEILAVLFTGILLLRLSQALAP